MNYILLTFSMLTMVIKNAIYNTVGKRLLTSDKDIYKFNAVMFILCAIAFFVLTLQGGLSLYTLLLGVVFGISTTLSNVYNIKAMASGAMHITVLIITSSLILPTVFGTLISGEALSLPKAAAIIALIGFIYLSSANDKKVKTSKKWVLYCAIAFLTSGIIGILQKIHQTSVHKNELYGFLGCSFAVSFILALLLSKKGESNTKFTSKQYLLAVLCGACVFAMNLINLKLSGIIPSQIFFPLINGGSIILSSLLSIFIFKEKITLRQTLGLVGGLASLIVICIC